MQTLLLSWIALLLLHQGYALIPVIPVQTGETVTFSCVFPDLQYSSVRVKWYKQSIGDNLKLITTLMQATKNPTFERGFPPSRFNANQTTSMSTLTILKTIQEDEAMYHCGVTTWAEDQWSGTYLSLKGNPQKTTDYTVVQRPIVSDPVHEGDSLTLQCSVLSDSEKTSCPGEHSVHWFGVSSDKSQPNVIYTDGNGRSDCDQKTERGSRSKSCVYRLSKDVRSSDAGTYYCAVATCGEIIFGNGTKLDIEGSSMWSFHVVNTDNIVVFLLCAVLATCVVIIASLIYAMKENTGDRGSERAALSLHENPAKRNLKREADSWIHSTVVFTTMNTGDANAVDRERIYAPVKVFGLDW